MISAASSLVATATKALPAAVGTLDLISEGSKYIKEIVNNVKDTGNVSKDLPKFAQGQIEKSNTVLDFNDADKPLINTNEVKEKNPPIENKEQGLRREEEVYKDLKDKYPQEEGYNLISESYLRDSDGKTVKDPETGEKRRVDFVVVKDGEVVDSIEVTSLTADKRQQCAKEERIRANGGNYIKYDEQLYKIPADLKTRVERRE